MFFSLAILALGFAVPAHAGGNASVRVLDDTNTLVSAAIPASDLLAVWAGDNLLVRVGHGNAARWAEVVGPEDGSVDLGLTLPGSVVGLDVDTVYVGFESMTTWTTGKRSLIGLDLGQVVNDGGRETVTGFTVEIVGHGMLPGVLNPETTLTAVLCVEHEDCWSGAVSFPATDADFWSTGGLDGVGMFAGTVGDMTDI